MAVDKCISEAFRIGGIDISEGLDDAEAKRVFQELENVTRLLADNPESKEARDAVNLSIKGAMSDRLEAKIITNKKILEIRKNFPNTKRGFRKAVRAFLGGHSSSVLKQADAENMFLHNKLNSMLDKETQAFLESTVSITGPTKKNEYLQRGIAELRYADDLAKTNIPEEYHGYITQIFNSLVETQGIKWYRMRSAGIKLGKVDFYTMKQTWDAKSVGAYSKDDFALKLEESIDIESTFTNEAYHGVGDEASKLRRQFYDDFYDKVTQPKSELDVDISNDPMVNALSGLSKSREIMFKNGEGEFNIRSAFSKQQGVAETIASDFLASSKLMSIRSNMSSSPKSMIDGLLHNLAKDLPVGDRKPFIDAAKSDSRVVLEMPTHSTGIASAVASTLSAIQMFKLGATMIRQAPFDIIPMTRTIMTGEGNVNAFSEFNRQIKNWTRTMAFRVKGEDVMAAQGLWYNSVMGDAMSRFRDTEAQVMGNIGGAEKIAQNTASTFLKYTGLDLLTNHNRVTQAIGVAGLFEGSINSAMKGFKEGDVGMNKAYKNFLEVEGGFTREEVIAMGDNMSILKDNGGDHFLGDQFSVDNILSIPSEKLNPKIASLQAELDGFKHKGKKYETVRQALYFQQAKTRRFKNNLHRKAKGLFVGKVDSGVPIPNPLYSVRRVMKGGQHVSGTQQLVGSFAMFKDTILNMTVESMNLAETHYKNVGASGMAISSASMVAGSTMFYLAMDMVSSAIMNKEPTFNKLISGKEDDALEEIVNRTSLVPMITDPILRLLAQESAFHKSALFELALGPVGGMIDDVHKATKRDDKIDSALRVGLRHLNPLSNWMTDSIGRHAGYDLKKMKPIRTGSEFRLGEQ